MSVLLSRTIDASVAEEEGSWVVWVQKDDDRDAARNVLNEFQVNPDAPEFAAAEKAAKEHLAAAQKSAKSRQRLVVDIRDRWNGIWWKCYPATVILIFLSALVVGICTDWKSSKRSHGLIPQTCNDENSRIRNALFIQSPDSLASEQGRDEARTGLPALAKTLTSGQLWRLVTPIFLHFDFLHIMFNMMWLKSLGRGVEFVRGTRRFLTLVVLIAVISNLTQLYLSGPAFGGMSGVVFGLIGYIWMKGRTQPQLGLGLPPDQIVWAMLFMLLCMGGSFGPIANAAHVSGLIVGLIIGARQAIWRQVLSLLSGKVGGSS